MYMEWLWIIPGVIVLLSSYFIGVGFAFGAIFGRRFIKKTIYLKPFFGPHFNKHTKTIQNTQKVYETLPFENLSIVSSGLNLHGKFYENPNSNKVIIFVHGYYSYGAHDVAFFGTLFKNLGVSLLVIDQRACGESEGRYSSLGILERFDVREWVFALNERFAGKKDIYLHGVSMGAATSLLVSALPGLPASLKGVIADCGFSRTNGVLLYAGNKLLKIRPRFLMWGLNLWAKAVGRFNLNSVKVWTELHKNDSIPLLFIHGTDDKFVPFNMSVKNFKNAAVNKKKLVAVANAHHCESYLVNSELYLKEMQEFLDGK